MIINLLRMSVYFFFWIWIRHKIVSPKQPLLLVSNKLRSTVISCFMSCRPHASYSPLRYFSRLNFSSVITSDVMSFSNITNTEKKGCEINKCSLRDILQIDKTFIKTAMKSQRSEKEIVNAIKTLRIHIQ